MSETKFVRSQQQDDILIVSPLFTFATLAESDTSGEWVQVQQQVESPAVKHVLVDLGQIPYFGSTVLEWMVQLWKRVKTKGGKLATCNASPIGREVLTTARFDLVWGIFNSREDALAWLTSNL